MTQRPEPTMAVRSWLRQLESYANGESTLRLRAAVAIVAARGAARVGEAPTAAFATGALRLAGALAPDAPPVTRLSECYALLDAIAEAERTRVWSAALSELYVSLCHAGGDELASELHGALSDGGVESREPTRAGTTTNEGSVQALMDLATVLAACDANSRDQQAALGCVARAARLDAVALVDWSTRRATLSVTHAPGAAVDALEAAAIDWAERLGGACAVPPPDARTRAALPGAIANDASSAGRVRVLPLAVEAQAPAGLLVFTESAAGVDARAMRAASAQLALALESRRRLENARAASARADERARSERETLSVISHDLRNPLSAILMSVALLQRSHRTDGSPTTRQIDVIKRSADRINYLLQNVSDSVSVDLGQLTVDPRPELLSAMVDDCLRMLAPQAQHKSVRLETDIPSEAVQVLADRERFVQTLANVLAARVRMAPRGGAVSVRARTTNGQLRVSVGGAAPGVADDEVRQWFDRAYWSRPNASPSTGIALSVARSIVEAHGGRMWAEPVADAGPVVEFTLPLATEQQIADARERTGTEYST